MYALNCGDDSKSKLKVICKSQSKNFKTEDCKKRIVGKDYQKECDKYLIRILNHDMYLQKETKNSVSPFDDK